MARPFWNLFALLALVACKQSAGENPDFDDGATRGDNTGDQGHDGSEKGSGTDSDPGTVDTPPDVPPQDDSAICGDGRISGPEQCDCGDGSCTLEGVGGVDCAAIGTDPRVPGPLTAGLPGCLPGSCQFDTSTCGYCGNGVLEGIEACEPEVPVPGTCDALGKGIAGLPTCTANCQLDTSACTDCVVTFDFADTQAAGHGFTSEALTDAPSSWAWGVPSDYAGGPGPDQGNLWATNLDGPYNNDESSALVSSAIDLSHCTGETITLTLDHWHNFEGGPGNADGALVQASLDGQAWTTLSPVAGSPYSEFAVGATSAPVAGSPGFSGNIDDEQWVQTGFDLSTYAGAPGLRLRFVLGSDRSTSFAGWYLRSLQILGGHQPRAN